MDIEDVLFRLEKLTKEAGQVGPEHEAFYVYAEGIDKLIDDLRDYIKNREEDEEIYQKQRQEK